ncbi:S9 family peptidase [Natronosporangium hydrolyticum]|uniref:prolyl oligopeptidase n=1 Tax=Natronosporangium hydrolyticum TaxID=2811111 RepID=A0A895YIH4_9ACTN|nr:prolyl oligopeptidase family serine peptidase [Natronosporangium hydrolyticum]QSB15163.1 S9 family peptidase [Natronosporangium hydrolyticum]
MSGTPGGAAWRYPETERDQVVETQHGVEVPDPYRWLEDPYAERTKRWVDAQNQLTGDYLAGLDSRPYFSERLDSLLSAPRAGTPRQRGGRYLRSYNDGTAQLDTVYVAESLPELLAGGRTLVDPAEFDPGGRVSVTQISVSPDGRWAAYGLSDGGSDWVQWRVRDIATGEDTTDRVSHAKFSGAEWLPDSASFLYWAYPDHAETTGADATALGTGRLLRHRLGTDQADDEVVSYRPEAPRERAAAEITEDGRWLVLTFVEGTARKTWVAVRQIGADGQLGPALPVVPEPEALYTYAGSDEDQLYLRTDADAARGRLLVVDLAAVAAGDDPASARRQLVAERDEVLTAVRRAGDGFLACYLDDAQDRIYRLSLAGERLGEVLLPGPLSLVSWSAHPGEDEAFLGITSFLDEHRSYRLAVGSGEVTPLPIGPVPATGGSTPAATGETLVGDGVGGPTVTERRRAPSADGTLVPYTMVRRADAPVGTPLPTLLYGYGGFNIPVTPSYRPIWPAWIEAGGAVVVANLRGGGEFGREWYEAGTRERKQNVFDDFVAVAEDLCATGVTTPGQLALHGRSNGGLLVGAVMTQRPELAAVALPMVGVLDMLRFHKFTIGWAWISDYGDPDDPADFEILRTYSPLHRLTEQVSYPATLVITGDHDDRVVPAHSHKFTATLQRVHAGSAPVLTRIETATGHGGGKPRWAIVAEAADMLAFAAEHTGLRPGKWPE